MTRADVYIEAIDPLRQPDRAGDHCTFECDRAPVLGAEFQMARGQVLAINFAGADAGEVRATFGPDAHVHAIVWYVPKGARARRG